MIRKGTGMVKKKLTPTERVTEWRKKNPAKFRKSRREYYRTHKEYFREYRKKRAAKIRKWRKKYSQRKEVKFANRMRAKVRRLESRLEIIKLLGGKCKKCSVSDFRILQIDHVKGGGNKDSKGFGLAYYRHVLKKIRNGSKDYQLLCSNCNWIKRWERNEVRREYKDETTYQEIYKLWKKGEDLSQLWKIRETKN